MIKITLSKVVLASIQVLVLYGWLAHRSVHLQRLKKNILIRKAGSECREGDSREQVILFPLACVVPRSLCSSVQTLSVRDIKNCYARLCESLMFASVVSLFLEVPG